MNLFKNKTLILFFIFLKVTSLYSIDLDSLYNKIEALKDDSLKVNQLNDYSEKFKFKNVAFSMKLAEQGAIISKKINYFKGLAKSYNLTGVGYLQLDDKQNAILYFKKAEVVSKQINDLLMLSKVYINIANCYQDSEKYEKSMYYFSAAIKIKHLIKDTIGENVILLSMMSLYSYQGNYELVDSIGNSLIPFFKLKNDIIHLSVLYEHMGVNAVNSGNYSKAISCFLNSLAYYEKGNMVNNHLYLYLSSAYLYNKDFTNAEKYLNKCLPYFFTGNQYCQLKGVYQQKSEIEFHKKQHVKAIMYLDSGCYYNNSFCNQKIYLQQNYYLYYKNYEALNKPLEALKYYKLFKTYSDSVKDELQNKNLLSLQTQYETKEKESQINILTSDKKRLAAEKLQLDTEKKLQSAQIELRNSIILLIVIVTLVAFVFYNRHKAKQKLVLENETIKAEKEIVELEQKLLLVQMNPHFIFNSLNSIKSFLVSNESENASKYLTNFAKLMRLILESSRKELITLEEEISLLTYYIDLEKLRLKNKFDCHFQIENKLQEELTDLMIPPMLLQPYIENAIIHGVLPLSNKGNIYIRILSENDSYVIIEIEDNGVGRQVNKAKEKHASLALKISEERLEGIEKKYKMQANVKIVDLLNEKNTSTGTKVVVTLPIIINEYHG